MAGFSKDIVEFGVSFDSRRMVAGINKGDRKLRELDRRAKRTQKAVSGLRSTANALGLAFSAIAAVQLGKDLFRLGLAAEETANKFNTVFGQSAGMVDQFNETFGRMAGLSRTAGRDMVATTGAIAQGMGFAQRASADFAVAVTRLAADVASFNNLETADVQHRINAALTGERESLKRLGIVILETDVQQRALNNTGKENVRLLTQQEKATATLQLITERAGVAVGDLARTQDSAANKARRLAAEMQTLKEEIGTGLMPVWTAMLGLVDDTIKGWQAMSDINPFASFQFDNIETARIRLRQTADEMAELRDVIAEGTTTTVNQAGALVPRLSDAAVEAKDRYEELKNEAIAVANALDIMTRAAEGAGGVEPPIIPQVTRGGEEGKVAPTAEQSRKFLAEMEVDIARKAGGFLDTKTDAEKNIDDLVEHFGDGVDDMQDTAVAGFLGMTGALENFIGSGLQGFDDLASAIHKMLQSLAAEALVSKAGKALGIAGFQSGGVVPGPIGAPQLAVVHGGETVIPAHQTAGTTIHQSVNFNVSAADGQSVAAFFAANKGEIAKVVAEAADQSSAFRRRLGR